ncbi:MAG: hypothetical protein IH786_09915 [Proteobacteria bacterium]|nr:hypothetical protein [Pseudomonadota bacterium]
MVEHFLAPVPHVQRDETPGDRPISFVEEQPFSVRAPSEIVVTGAGCQHHGSTGAKLAQHDLLFGSWTHVCGGASDKREPPAIWRNGWVLFEGDALGDPVRRLVIVELLPKITPGGEHESPIVG